MARAFSPNPDFGAGRGSVASVLAAAKMKPGRGRRPQNKARRDESRLVGMARRGRLRDGGERICAGAGGSITCPHPAASHHA